MQIIVKALSIHLKKCTYMRKKRGKNIYLFKIYLLIYIFWTKFYFICSLYTFVCNAITKTQVLTQ